MLEATSTHNMYKIKQRQAMPNLPGKVTEHKGRHDVAENGWQRAKHRENADAEVVKRRKLGHVRIRFLPPPANGTSGSGSVMCDVMRDVVCDVMCDVVCVCVTKG